MTKFTTRGDLQDEPHFSMRADFQTDDSSLNDSQSMRNDTQRLMTKAQVHNFSQNLPLNEQKSQKNANTEFSNDLEFQNRNSYFQLENQKIANDTLRSHDNQAIVMANDEAFGALDFQHDDIQLDADNKLLQQSLPAFSDDNPIELSLDAQNWPSNPQNDDRNIDNIFSNNNPPNAQTFHKIRDIQLESDVEDRPHTETEPQLLQQQDNVLTVDPVPESRYNLRNKNRLNPYTFSGKVSEKWIETPRRTRRRARSLDQKL